MKFELIMLICSVLAGSCSQPVKQTPLFINHYECATVGYLRALKILDSLGADIVNNNKVVVSFRCSEILDS
jgi:hypothetical protein|tara:strand:- start:9523 stop:9735 length:213 start_codon:yes stop_codon:yes gene_type:complete